MKVLKKITVAGAFARKRSYEYEGKQYQADIKHGDVVKLLDAGQLVTGQYGEQHVFSIETRNGPKNLTFNQTTLNNLVDAFGDETSQWIGKSVQAWVIKVMVSGKLQDVAYLAPSDWEMDEDGRFLHPATATQENRAQESQASGVEYPEEEINPDDIPF